MLVHLPYFHIKLLSRNLKLSCGVATRLNLRLAAGYLFVFGDPGLTCIS